MPNGQTCCVAKSSADFYHNGTDTSTCKINVFKGAAKDNHLESSVTASGPCP